MKFAFRHFAAVAIGALVLSLESGIPRAGADQVVKHGISAGGAADLLNDTSYVGETGSRKDPNKIKINCEDDFGNQHQPAESGYGSCVADFKSKSKTPAGANAKNADGKSASKAVKKF